jgi:hypothetical protein
VQATLPKARSVPGLVPQRVQPKKQPGQLALLQVQLPTIPQAQRVLALVRVLWLPEQLAKIQLGPILVLEAQEVLQGAQVAPMGSRLVLLKMPLLPMKHVQMTLVIQALLEPVQTRLEPQMRPTKMRPTQMRPTQMRPTQMKPTQMRPMQMRPTQTKPLQMRPEELKPLALSGIQSDDCFHHTTVPRFQCRVSSIEYQVRESACKYKHCRIDRSSRHQYLHTGRPHRMKYMMPMS